MKGEEEEERTLLVGEEGVGGNALAVSSGAGVGSSGMGASAASVVLVSVYKIKISSYLLHT